MKSVADDINRLGKSVVRRMPDTGCALLRSRGIETLAFFDAGPGLQVVARRPESVLMLVSQRGRGQVCVGGQWRACRGGEIHVAPAGGTQGYRWGDGSVWKFIEIQLRKADGAGALSAPARVVPVNADHLAHAAEGMYWEASHDCRGYQLELWARAVHSCMGDVTGWASGEDPLSGLWREVDAKLEETWTVARLAERSGIRPSMLKRLCVQRYGRTPMKQISEMRMRRAEPLVVNTQEAIHHIAGRVGYASVYAFTAAFSRWKGVAPAALRTQGAGTD